MASAKDETKFGLKRRFEEKKKKRFIEDVWDLKGHWKKNKNKVLQQGNF